MIYSNRYNEKAGSTLPSLLGLGTMRLPRLSPDSPKIDYKAAGEMLDLALASGVTYIDTAYMYHDGDSEVFLGEALKKHPRDSYLLATKMPVWQANEPADMERIFSYQLKKTGAGYFDYYLMHSMNASNFNRAREYGLYGFLSKMKAQGYIRKLGFSFHDSPAVLKKLCDAYAWDFVQIQLNYVDWELQDAKSQYQTLASRNIPVIVMEPVRGGALAAPGAAATALMKESSPDATPASFALRFAASLPGVMTVLSGMSNMEQLRENIALFDSFKPLSEDEQKMLERAAYEFRVKDVLPCTSCRYCSDCPQGIDIPALLSLWNTYAQNRSKSAFRTAYAALDQNKRADFCIGCGACAEHCPQHINIPEAMVRIAKLAN